MIILEHTMYCLDSRGGVRVWTIEADDDYVLIMTFGILNGAMQQKTEMVYENKSGRNIDEQAELQFNSRINKMKDKGYVDTIEQAQEGRVNILSLPKPMLAVPYEKIKGPINYNDLYIQRKYDGNRCLIANIGGEIIAYTRNGKLITTCDHITEGIEIPEGVILDGELYAHGEKLQTIVSWVKRKQANTGKLKYHCYDYIDDDRDPFNQRLDHMNYFQLGNNAEIVGTYACSNIDIAMEMFRGFRAQGYEGAILRLGSASYEDGKRSKSLIKMKEWHDSEFMVHRIERSKDGWGILIMKAPNGREFKASAPGTMEERYIAARNAEQYIGEYVTIEYAFLTKDGVPFHPVAKVWRTQ